MTAQPLLKHNELIERLQIISAQPNDFQLRQIEREAEKLLSVDAAHGYMVLGIISGIRGDIKGVHDNHLKSIRLSDSVMTRQNYGTSLGFLRCLPEAIEQLDLALKHETTPELLRYILHVAFQAAYPHRTLHYYQKLIKLQPERVPSQEVVKMVEQAQRLIDAGLSDEESSAIHKLTEIVCKEFGTSIDKNRTWIDYWGEDQPSLVNWLLVKSDRIPDMNWRLAGLLAEHNFPSLAEGRYHVAFHRLVS